MLTGHGRRSRNRRLDLGVRIGDGNHHLQNDLEDGDEPGHRRSIPHHDDN